MESDRSPHPHLRVVPLAVIVAALVGAAGNAGAVSFQIEFASSTYQVQAGDTYADLLAEHQSSPLLSSDTVTALAGISAPVYAGTNVNYSTLMTTVLNIATPGVYQFQVGTDWGRGGASVVIDNTTGAVIDEFVTTADIWWGNDWNNADVFVTTLSLAAGESYTLSWIGFEDCCGGAMTVRFSFEGGAFLELDDVNLAPYVAQIPEPGTGLMVAAGLAILAAPGHRCRSRRPAHSG